MERVFSLGVTSPFPQHGPDLLPHPQPRATAAKSGREQEDFHFWLFHVRITVSCAQSTEIEQAVFLFLRGEEQDPHLGGTLGKMGHVAIGESCHSPHIVGAHRDAPVLMLIHVRGLRSVTPSESSPVTCLLPILLSVQADLNFIWKQSRVVSAAPLHPAQRG